MDKIIDKLLLEWSYRVDTGMPDPKNIEHKSILNTILKEYGWDIELRSEFFNSLTEADKVYKSNWPGGTAPKGVKILRGPRGGEYYYGNKDTGEPADKSKTDNVTTTSYPNEKGKILQDKGTDWEIKQKGLEYGYGEVKDENGKTIFKAAPGNAGSMWNEIMSGEVANILELEPGLSDEEITDRLMEQFGDTKLAQQNSGSSVTAGLGIKAKDVPEKHSKNKALYSKTLNTVRAGRRKHDKAVKSAKALGIKKPKINHFYGHADSLQKMEDNITEMPEGAKIYSVDEDGKKYEIPRDDAIELIKASGGGQNPSDTATFVTDPKSGDVIMHFHSDKDSLNAITAQSSVNKEVKELDNIINKLHEDGKIDDNQREQLFGQNDLHRENLAKIESKLKTVQKEAGQFFTKMKDSSLDTVLKNIKEDRDSTGKITTDKAGKKVVEKTSTKWKDATKKKFSPPKGKFQNYLSDSSKENWDSLSDADKEREQLRAFFSFMSDTPQERAKKIGVEFDEDNLITSTDAEDTLMDRINAKYREEGSPDTYGDIEKIREEYAEQEKEHFDELNEIQISSDPDITLGQMMEGNTVWEQFHLEAMNPNSDRGVHKYPGLFETNHGGVSVDGSVLRDVFGTSERKDFVSRFEFETQSQKGSSGAMKGRTTGETRNVYLITKDNKRILVGEKRLRTKTGKMGKLQTVYKWHNDAIKELREKGLT